MGASTFQADMQTKTPDQEGTSGSKEGGQSMEAKNEVPGKWSVQMFIGH